VWPIISLNKWDLKWEVCCGERDQTHSLCFAIIFKSPYKLIENDEFNHLINILIIEKLMFFGIFDVLLLICGFSKILFYFIV
jgi:hypothetical protein